MARNPKLALVALVDWNPTSVDQISGVRPRITRYDSCGVSGSEQDHEKSGQMVAMTLLFGGLGLDGTEGGEFGGLTVVVVNVQTALVASRF